MKIKEFLYFTGKVVLAFIVFRVAIGLLAKASPTTASSVQSFMNDPLGAVGIA